MKTLFPLLVLALLLGCASPPPGAPTAPRSPATFNADDFCREWQAGDSVRRERMLPGQLLDLNQFLWGKSEVEIEGLLGRADEYRVLNEYYPADKTYRQVRLMRWRLPGGKYCCIQIDSGFFVKAYVLNPVE